MTEQLLVVGSDAPWLKAMELLLETPTDDAAIQGVKPPKVIACLDDATALAVLREDKSEALSAAVIFGYHTNPAFNNAMSAPGYAARELAINLRAQRRSLPIILVAPNQLEILDRFAMATETAEVIYGESIEAIRAAIQRMNKLRERTGKSKEIEQPWAQVDISVEVDCIKVRIALANQELLLDTRIPSDLRAFLEDEQEEFERLKAYQFDSGPGKLPRVDDRIDSLPSAGNRLHQYLMKGEPMAALEQCLKRVRDMENIHFRILADHRFFPDVPFDVLRDRVRKKFIRDMSPTARQVPLQQSEATVAIPDPIDTGGRLSSNAPLTGRFLFIQSNTSAGSLSVGRHTFGGDARKNFARLPDLAREWTATATARSQGKCSEPVPCVLEAGVDCLAALDKAIGEGPWDIVHFCGHSIKADDKEVFIVLPGKDPTELTGMPMGRFAQILRRARVRLLVLSSCEGASSLGIFRLAQEGIPAIVGFRWEVMSSQATKFVEILHTKLAACVPIGRSYMEALRALPAGSPAFLSAMLVVQYDPWGEPALIGR